MYLDQNIKINSMADAARKTFESTDKRLEEIESNFHSKMRGRSMGGVIGSFFGTAIWLVALGTVAYNCQGYVDNTLLTVTIAVIALFMITVFIGDAMNFKYFGKVSSYGSSVSQLRSRVRVGRDSISQNKETYMNSSTNGWDYRLEMGESISDEATSIEGTLSGMDSLKTGFLSNAKLWLLYASVIMVTIVGSVMLFSAASSFIYGLFDGDVSNDLLNAVCWIGLIIACVGACFLTNLLWSHLDCEVNNLTIFAVFAGPILFIALECLGALVVWVVIMLVALAIAIAGIAIAIFCASAMCGG